MSAKPQSSNRFFVLLALMAFLLSTLATGCIVRTGSSSKGVRHAHKHCHNKRVRRGVTKRKCHRHSHRHNRRGGGHH